MELQFNDGGTVGSSSNLRFNKVSNALSVGALYNGWDGSFAINVNGILRVGEGINFNNAANPVFTGLQNSYPYLDFIDLQPKVEHIIITPIGLTSDGTSGFDNVKVYAGNGGSSWNYIAVGNNETRISSAGAIHFSNGYSPNQEIAQLVDDGSFILQTGGSLNAITSAIMQVNSTTRGFLPPRMSTTQKNAINSPAEGLTVYDNTLKKMCIYTGSAWEAVTSV